MVILRFYFTNTLNSVVGTFNFILWLEITTIFLCRDISKSSVGRSIFIIFNNFNLWENIVWIVVKDLSLIYIPFDIAWVCVFIKFIYGFYVSVITDADDSYNVYNSNEGNAGRDAFLINTHCFLKKQINCSLSGLEKHIKCINITGC